VSRYDETIAALRCRDSSGQDPKLLVEALRLPLAEAGFRLAHVDHVAEDETILYGEDMILSLARDEGHDHDFIVAAETRAGAADEIRLTHQRMLICATATRVLCERLPVTSVSWSHAGEFYVTDINRNFSKLEICKKTMREALSTMAEGLICGADKAIRRKLRQYFPADEDIVMASRSHD
jgi:hypothetical protein